jgi:uncharacterized protein (DUF1501 family)
MYPSRRDFLKSIAGTSTLLSLSHAMPSFLQRTAWAAASKSASTDNVLIVLQLSGGNDGLNTVVPYDDDAYGRSRRTLRLTSKDVHKLNEQLGFHPQMPKFKQLLDAGHLTIVQGVGYTNSNRDHDVALRDWHTAEPGQPECQTGWVGRFADAASERDNTDVPGALVSSIPMPFALNAERSVIPAIPTADQWMLQGDHGDWMTGVGDVTDAEGSLLDAARSSTRAADQLSRRVEDTLAKTNAAPTYPRFTLAGQLRTVAQLIRADLGIRVYFTELGGGGIGGFDNHANQRDNHAALLRELSESIAAFIDDLKQDDLHRRVVLMTFSEFGRTVSENGRRGTGHGAAAPVFLAGGSLRSGLHGDHPSLTDLEADAPKPHTDFRQVYATMMDRWLGIDSQIVLRKKYKTLDVFA